MPLFTDSDRLRWVNDGQKVTADIGRGRGLPCVVVKAAGYTALVRSLATSGPYAGWEAWRDVSDLFPEVTPEMRDNLRLKIHQPNDEGTA